MTLYCIDIMYNPKKHRAGTRSDFTEIAVFGLSAGDILFLEIGLFLNETSNFQRYLFSGLSSGGVPIKEIVFLAFTSVWRHLNFADSFILVSRLETFNF